MKKINEAEDEKLFLSNPRIVENYTLLQEIGVFKHIDYLNREIHNFKNLYAGALEIFNTTSIEQIIDATVRRISDQFLPSFLVFLWKPLQNKEEITIKGFKNYKLIDLNLHIESIKPFEEFFVKYNKPISYDLLSYQLGNDEALKCMDPLHPELVIPITGPSGLYGLVLIGRKILEDDYSASELEYLQRLMSFVSQAIQNNLHYERTLRDVKTGLFNNGFFMTRLNEEIARSHRMGSSASIIIMDVDKFKNFNDTYGHLAGDKVLETLAVTIKQGVRAEDVPSRFGGEEFTVLLPDSDRKSAYLAAERLRTMVANMMVPWHPPLPQVTISLGVVTFNKDTQLPAEEIIHCADEALYLSKERGRNRTTVWGTGLLSKIERLSQETRDAAPPAAGAVT